MITFRNMVEDDIKAGLDLCRSAGWNQLSEDWKLFLALKHNGSRVAIDEHGDVAGTVATIDYGNRFSWIGMVLVHPEKKRQGIGTSLLNEALHILKNMETVKLDATPAGREVYLKLGFRDEYTLSRMVAQQVDTSSIRRIKNVSIDDFRWIEEMDSNVFGADRSSLLKKIHSLYPDLSFTTGETVASYCFGRKGFNYTQVGPVIADDINDAKVLTLNAIAKKTQPVVMDVMHGSPFYEWLLSIGFSEQRKLIRMFKGVNNHPGQPDRQFAILGPEFG